MQVFASALLSREDEKNCSYPVRSPRGRGDTDNSVEAVADFGGQPTAALPGEYHRGGVSAFVINKEVCSYHAPSFGPHHQISPTVAVLCSLLKAPWASLKNDG